MAKIVELIIDEENYRDGVFAVSLVDEPAIELDFLALSKEQGEVKLQVVSEEKRVLLGALLVPDKHILRKDKDGKDYYVKFSKDTIRKASEIFFRKGNQNNATIGHSLRLEGATIFESWIKEDEEKDKSLVYGLEAPIGTWFVSMKVDNTEIWDKFIKSGLLKGFSIEGLFEDSKVVEARNQKLSKEEVDILEDIVNILTS